MPVTINSDGSVNVVAHTMTPGGNVFTSNVTTRTEIYPDRVRVVSTMPGIIRKRKTITTTIELTAADIVALLRWHLENPGESGERLREAFLDMPEAAAVGWVEYFLGKVSE